MLNGTAVTVELFDSDSGGRRQFLGGARFALNAVSKFVGGTAADREATQQVLLLLQDVRSHRGWRPLARVEGG